MSARTQPSDTPPRRGMPDLPPFEARPTTWHSVNTPRWIDSGARRLGLAFLLLAAIMAVVPWQQNATGAGSVIAYDPAMRQQTVQAPVKGRVITWFVREGQRVEEGQPLVELRDNDPLLVSRLEDQRGLATVRADAARAKVEASETKLEAAQQAREAALAAADAKIRGAEEDVRSAREDLLAAEATWTTASVQLERAESLHADGLRSDQELENARLKAEQARAKMASAEAKLSNAQAKRSEAVSEREKARTEADGKVAAARSELEAARGEVATYDSKRVDLDGKLAVQDTRIVTAPAAGFVARVYGGQGGEQVKVHDELILLVPETESRAVELYVDGNDAVLVRPGEEVRLQFEGWPALQFAGWPGVAMGTFGGVVDFVDQVDNGKGDFRVMVLPKPDDHPWPDASLLRQGVRAKGWVMLAQVPLGYELWRQLNDFPPAVPIPTKDGDKVGDPVEKSKAGKAWRPK